MNSLIYGSVNDVALGRRSGFEADVRWPHAWRATPTHARLMPAAVARRRAPLEVYTKIRRRRARLDYTPCCRLYEIFPSVAL